VGALWFDRRNRRFVNGRFEFIDQYVREKHFLVNDRVQRTLSVKNEPQRKLRRRDQKPCSKEDCRELGKIIGTIKEKKSNLLVSRSGT